MPRRSTIRPIPPRAILVLALGAVLTPAPGGAADPYAPAVRAYESTLQRYRTQGRLDNASEILARARRITSQLVAQAPSIRPESSLWPWEVHVADDPNVAAFCMAGGKIVVGAPFVQRLDLSDAELAMLLAHEMAHALAGHRIEAHESSPESDPAEETRAVAHAIAMEDEADRLGMKLAHRAGWPAQALVGFYDKLAAQEPAGTFNSTHPSARQRAERANRYAEELGRAGSR